MELNYITISLGIIICFLYAIVVGLYQLIEKLDNIILGINNQNYSITDIGDKIDSVKDKVTQILFKWKHFCDCKINNKGVLRYFVKILILWFFIVITEEITPIF